MARLEGLDDGAVREVGLEAKDRLKTSSINVSSERFINERDKKYWSIPFIITPTGANDYFVYIRNDSDNNLHITDFRISSTVAGIVHINGVTGTVGNGSNITTGNRTVGNANTLESGATVETSVAFTGLTKEAGTRFYMTLEADKQSHLRTSGNIILPKGQAIALLWDTATGALTGIVSAFEDTVNS